MVKYTLILLLLAGVFCNESKPSVLSRLKSLKCAFPPREILDQLPPACKSEDLSKHHKALGVNKEFYLCIGLLEIGERLCELAEESSSFSSYLSTNLNKTIKESPASIVDHCTEGHHLGFIEPFKYEGSRILFEKITDSDTCMLVCAEQSDEELVSPICKALLHGNDMLRQPKSSSTGNAEEDKPKSVNSGSPQQQTPDQQSQQLGQHIAPQQPLAKETGPELPKLKPTNPLRSPSQPGKTVDQLLLKRLDQEPPKSDPAKTEESGTVKPQVSVVQKQQEAVVQKQQDPVVPMQQDSVVPMQQDSVVQKEPESVVSKKQDSVVPEPQKLDVSQPEKLDASKQVESDAAKSPQNTELVENHNLDDGKNQNKAVSTNTGKTEDKAPDSNGEEESRLTPGKEQSAIKDPSSNSGGSNSGAPAITPSSGNVQSVLKSAKSDDTDSTNIGIKDENLPADENVNPDKIDQNNPVYQGGLEPGTEDDGTNVEDDPSMDDEGEIHNVQTIEEGKPSNVDGSQIGSVQKDVPNVPQAEPEKSNEFHENYSQFVDAEDSHFFTYFLIGSLLCIIGYLLYHNKRKIIAMAVEGKKGRNSGRRRPHSASYHKLDSNLEEAMSSNFTSSNSYVIY